MKTLMGRRQAKPGVSNHGPKRTSRAVRFAAAVLTAGLAAGCFQPLYGERTFTGAPGLRTALAAVDVAQIDASPGTPLARLAVEVRNELTYRLTGGAGAPPATHRLVVALRAQGTSLVVDPSTARAEFEIVGLDAEYKLTELASSKQVFNASAMTRVSYDIPGQQQRFSALRGQRDAQSRAAKVLADQIHARLASYFAAGS